MFSNGWTPFRGTESSDVRNWCRARFPGFGAEFSPRGHLELVNQSDYYLLQDQERAVFNYTRRLFLLYPRFQFPNFVTPPIFRSIDLFSRRALTFSIYLRGINSQSRDNLPLK